MKRIKENSTILILLAVFAIGFTSACGEAKTENKNVQNNVIAGGGNTVSPNENKSVNTEKTPAPVKETKQTDELPTFEKEEDYKIVRTKLLKAGWNPARSEDGKENCIAGGKTCEEFPELDAGPSSPLGQAILRWQKGDKILLIHTIDSFLFDSYEYEKPKKTQSKPNIEGKFVYKSKHEYGEDTFVWELKKGNVATYVSEREGGDGADLKGTWKLNEADKTITVNFPDAPDGAETYVFKLEGKNLKMIKEPNLPKGAVGFSGTIFKRQ